MGTILTWSFVRLKEGNTPVIPHSSLSLVLHSQLGKPWQWHLLLSSHLSSQLPRSHSHAVSDSSPSLLWEPSAQASHARAFLFLSLLASPTIWSCHCPVDILWGLLSVPTKLLILGCPLPNGYKRYAKNIGSQRTNTKGLPEATILLKDLGGKTF